MELEKHVLSIHIDYYEPKEDMTTKIYVAMTRIDSLNMILFRRRE